MRSQSASVLLHPPSPRPIPAGDGAPDDMLIALLLLLGLAILAYAYAFVRAAIAQRVGPSPEAIVLGAIVSFLDTLGIGSFAPTTAWFRFRRMVPDRLIPPTLLVGLTPGATAQSIIFLILLGIL